MKIQEGVDVQIIASQKFTTNVIKVRFSAPIRTEQTAGRVLAANIMEVCNATYPTGQLLRKKLASLYGTRLSTTVHRKGKVDMVDVTLSYPKSSVLPNKEDLTSEILSLLGDILFSPIKEKGKKSFDKAIFEVEQQHLISYLESESEDHFYHADKQVEQLFYQDSDLQVPMFSTIELVEKQTVATAYKAFQDMLRFDKIDVFVLGDVPEKTVSDWVKECAFTYRNPKLASEYQQPLSSVVKEKTERMTGEQSILELAYNLQLVYNDVNYHSFLVWNGLFGAFPHSKLFSRIREKQGLAYTIGTDFDVFSGLLKVYAGIDKQQRIVVLKSIHREFLNLKTGKFTEEELELTKKMLVHAMDAAQDQSSVLLEQAYQQQLFGERYFTIKESIEAIQCVTKEDVMQVAQLLQLQALYFMEGVG